MRGNPRGGVVGTNGAKMLSGAVRAINGGGGAKMSLSTNGAGGGMRLGNVFLESMELGRQAPAMAMAMAMAWRFMITVCTVQALQSPTY